MHNRIGFLAILNRKDKRAKDNIISSNEARKESIRKHKELLKEIHDTYVKKNEDYGDSFSLTIKRWGYAPAIARIEDKVRRAGNIVIGKQMNYKEESLRDNLLDIANYCIMTIMTLDEDKLSLNDIVRKIGVD